MTDTTGMTDEEYMTFLLDRAAQRYGYESHEAWCKGGIDPTMSQRLAQRQAKEEADGRAWAQAQLPND